MCECVQALRCDYVWWAIHSLSYFFPSSSSIHRGKCAYFVIECLYGNGWITSFCGQADEVEYERITMVHSCIQLAIGRPYKLVVPLHSPFNCALFWLQKKSGSILFLGQNIPLNIIITVESSSMCWFGFNDDIVDKRLASAWTILWPFLTRKKCDCYFIQPAGASHNNTKGSRAEIFNNICFRAVFVGVHRRIRYLCSYTSCTTRRPFPFNGPDRPFSIPLTYLMLYKPVSTQFSIELVHRYHIQAAKSMHELLAGVYRCSMSAIQVAIVL